MIALIVWPDQRQYLRDHPELSASALMRAAIDAHRGARSPYESDAFAREERARLAVTARLRRIEANRPGEIAELRAAFRLYLEAAPSATDGARRRWVESRRSDFPTLAADDPRMLLAELAGE